MPVTGLPTTSEQTRSPVDGSEYVRLATTGGGNWKAQVWSLSASALDLRAFGAVGNGSTDDTAAVTAAFAAASSRKLPLLVTGGGTYVVGNITIPSNLVLLGDRNTTFKLKNNTTDVVMFRWAAGTTTTNVCFADLIFDGNMSGQAGFPHGGTCLINGLDPTCIVTNSAFTGLVASNMDGGLFGGGMAGDGHSVRYYRCHWRDIITSSHSSSVFGAELHDCTVEDWYDDNAAQTVMHYLCDGFDLQAERSTLRNIRIKTAVAQISGVPPPNAKVGVALGGIPTATSGPLVIDATTGYNLLENIDVDNGAGNQNFAFTIDTGTGNRIVNCTGHNNTFNVDFEFLTQTNCQATNIMCVTPSLAFSTPVGILIRDVTRLNIDGFFFGGNNQLQDAIFFQGTNDGVVLSNYYVYNAYSCFRADKGTNLQFYHGVAQSCVTGVDTTASCTASGVLVDDLVLENVDHPWELHSATNFTFNNVVVLSGAGNPPQEDDNCVNIYRNNLRGMFGGDGTTPYQFTAAIGSDIGARLNAVMAAIADTPAPSSNEAGGIVQLPPGWFYSTVPIIVPTTIKLRGAGKRSTGIYAKIGTFPNSGKLITLGRVADGIAFDCSVEDMRVDTQGITGTIGVYSNIANEGCGVQRCVVTNFRDTGIFYDTNCENFRNEDLEVLNTNSTSNYGIKINGTETLSFDRVTVFGFGVGNMTAGVYLTGTSQVLFNNLHLEGCTDGVLIDSASVSGCINTVNGVSSITNVIHYSIATTSYSPIVVIGAWKGLASVTIKDDSTTSYNITDTFVPFWSNSYIYVNSVVARPNNAMSLVAGSANAVMRPDNGIQFQLLSPNAYIGSGAPGSYVQFDGAGVVGFYDWATGTAGTHRAVARTSSQITSDQNNYQPGGFSQFQRWSTDAARNVTGLTFGSSSVSVVSPVDGQQHTIINVGTQNLVLKHQSASSSAAYRFLCSSGGDITLAGNQAADVIYDNTQQRWLTFKRN